MKILFRDEHLAVVYKPYGVLSEDSESPADMPSLLRGELGCEIYPVHRLDRTTQGLMVYAKTREAAKRLSAMVQRGELEKIYLAVVGGVPNEPSGEWEDLLYFDRRKNKSYVVNRERRGVKRARLCYETLSERVYEGQRLSLLRIRLLTGRTHQIRVQCASRALPLVGDRRYGSQISADTIALCAARLCFTHPFTGERLDFSYMPDDGVFRLFSESIK